MDEYIALMLSVQDQTQSDTDVTGDYTCTLASGVAVTFWVTGDGVPLGDWR